MKLAFVLTQSLESPSGVGRFGPIARNMVDLGQQVELIALHPDWSSLQNKEMVDHGVRVRYVGQMHVQKRGSQKTYFNTKKLLWISLHATLQLAKAVYASEADVIHVCKPHPMNLIAARWGRRRRPLYCDCDDYEAESNLFKQSWQRHIVRHFEDSIVGDFVGLTVNTQFTRQRYIELGFPPDRIQYIPNGVERDRLLNRDYPVPHSLTHLPPSSPLILYIGTLGLLAHPVDLLLYAFQEIVQHTSDVHLALVGGGEDFDRLKQQIVDLGISEKTIITGHIPAVEVPNYLARATVTVDPVFDNLIARARYPLKIVESIALGVPVVTSNVGDRGAILRQGELGVLVPPGNSHEIAQGLLKIIQNKDLRKKISNAALAQRANYYWDKIGPDLLDFYLQ